MSTDLRADPGIAQEILEFIDQHRVLSVAMTDSIIGCPHQERTRLRRRMVSSLRVLARTRSLYGADGQLDSRCSYRGREHRPRAQCHGGQSIGLSVARASQNDRLQPRADTVLSEALPSLRTAATA